MGLSLEERKRLLIDSVCASCSGGGGTEVGGGGETGEDMGMDTPENLAKALSKIRSKKKKGIKENGA